MKSKAIYPILRLEFNSFIIAAVLFITITFAPSSKILGQSGSSAKIYPPTGKLVDVGGYRLHINCQGKSRKGSPTVVMESGAGDFSFDWSLVQPEVARFTRVCAYDRAGYAWSEAGPMPRTMRQISSELYTGLKKVGVKENIILVGHSLGGLIVRVFAQQYSDEVVGMVLIDSSHEDNQIMLNGKVMILRETSRRRTIPPVQLKKPETKSSNQTNQNNQSSPSTRLKLDSPFDKLPSDIQQIRLWAMTQPGYNEARSSEFDYLAEELALMHDERSKSEYPLGDMPLIVLTRGKNASQNHKKLQADLIRLSRSGKQIIAETSDHHIQLDAPNLVSDAIRQIFDAAQQNKKLKK